MLYKTIIQGRLEFGNPKSYEKVLKMFQYRAENYYKSDILLKEEDIFHQDSLSLRVPRYVGQCLHKSWQNTVSLLDYCSQFAIAGSIRAWLTESGKILHYDVIEPQGDKAAVQQFIKGRSLVREMGKEDEAIEALTKAIEKYNRHAQAYERRAKINFILKNYGEALRDYNKSIGIDDSIPNSFYGRAKVHVIKEEYDKAIADFDKAIVKSIALQPIYWKARRLKAEIHIKLKQFEKAEFDLKLFTKRHFTPDNPNFVWRRKALFLYGKVLLELEKYVEAIDAFTEALEIQEGYDQIAEEEKLFFLGLAKQKAGKNGYLKEIKQAADLGFERAKTMLEEYA